MHGSPMNAPDSTSRKYFDSGEMCDGHGGGDGRATGQFLRDCGGQVSSSEFKEVAWGDRVEEMVKVVSRKAELDSAGDQCDVNGDDAEPLGDFLELDGELEGA